MRTRVLAGGASAVAFALGFFAGDLAGACQGNSCIEPWAWWRNLSSSDQGAWASAFATTLAALVALATPWIMQLLANAQAEKRDEHQTIQLSIALSFLLSAIHERIKVARVVLADMMKRDDSTIHQQVTHLRIPEIHTLAEYRSSFSLLRTAGFSLETLVTALTMYDAEIAGYEEAGARAINPLTKRMKDLHQMLGAVIPEIEALTGPISEAAEARSVRPLAKLEGS